MLIRAILADLRDAAKMMLGQAVALTVLLGPIIGLVLLVANARNLPPAVQYSAFWLAALTELAWMTWWALKVHRLANSLDAHSERLKSVEFQVWQQRRELKIMFPGRSPLEGLRFNRRYTLARRLAIYSQQVDHNRLWERAIRLVPRRFAVYVAAHAGMTTLLDAGRMDFVRMTGNFDRLAWANYLAAKVETLYTH